jgi:G protein-coupled receptor 107
VYLLRTTTEALEYGWVSDFAEQMATLAFYVWTAMKFRPQPNNPYLKLEQAEIEM